MKTDTGYFVLHALYPQYARPDPVAFMNHASIWFYNLSVFSDMGDGPPPLPTALNTHMASPNSDSEDDYHKSFSSLFLSTRSCLTVRCMALSSTVFLVCLPAFTERLE